MSLFVTGTDTGVGKTHTVVQLLRLLRAAGKSCAGFKPICCGDRHDAELLLAAGSEGFTIDEVNPLWLKTPLAPLASRSRNKRRSTQDDYLLRSPRCRNGLIIFLLKAWVVGWCQSAPIIS